MKKTFTLFYQLGAGAFLLFAASCSKETSSLTKSSTSSAKTTSTLLTTNEAIFAGVVSTSSDSAKTDSVYMVGCYPGGGHPDSVSFSSLPAAVSTYLTANYSGYTFGKAFKALTKSGATDGYVVLIKYDGKPVGLKFDVNGAFVAVLEQMDKQDMGGGQGWHPGSPFGNRNGMHQDSIAVSALPAAIKGYFAANYPSDTLLHADKNPDSSYTVISKDKGLFATSFTSKLTFVKRLQLMPPSPGFGQPVVQNALPATVTAYLTKAYPGYVFDKAFSTGPKGTITGYVVLIDANSTRYSLAFDGSGNYLKSIVLH